MTKFALSFLRDESGASAAEYAVLLTIVTAALILAVGFLGSAISGVFSSVAHTLTTAA
jgi:pilus assembly protein Flp/PilA